MNTQSSEIYKNLLLLHNKTPKNYGLLTLYTIKEFLLNELCGDKIEATLLVEKDKITDIGFVCECCAVCKASASMFFDMIKGCRVEEAVNLAQLFKNFFVNNNIASAEEIRSKLKDLMVFESLKNYPSRVKCVLLSAELILKIFDTSN